MQFVWFHCSIFTFQNKSVYQQYYLYLKQQCVTVRLWFYPHPIKQQLKLKIFSLRWIKHLSIYYPLLLTYRVPPSRLKATVLWCLSDFNTQALISGVVQFKSRAKTRWCWWLVKCWGGLGWGGGRGRHKITRSACIDLWPNQIKNDGLLFAHQSQWSIGH